MAPSSPAARGKTLRVKLAVGAVALLAVAALVARGVNLHALIQRGVDATAAVGPTAFFLGLAVLPAFGVPALPFMVTAASAFGARLGMPGVLACAFAAMAANMALSYWLARFALRPWLTRLVARLGHRLPEVPPGDTTALIVLLRVTPGVPFFAQNYLLGLADVPPGKYLAVSCAAAWPITAAWIYFGEALQKGRGKYILLAVLLLVALTAGAWLVRRHHGRKTFPRSTES
jgi:uncharacterized membrane protein YdjX (TVP38/TMEM64 family)